MNFQPTPAQYFSKMDQIPLCGRICTKVTISEIIRPLLNLHDYIAVWSINDELRPIHSLSYIIGPRPVGLLPNTTYQKDGDYFNPEIPWDMSLISYFYFEGQYYNWEYFHQADKMICIQTNNYGWGFSSTLALYFDLLFGIWCVVTYGVCVHINCKSEMSLKGRVMDSVGSDRIDKRPIDNRANFSIIDYRLSIIIIINLGSEGPGRIYPSYSLF